MFGFLDFSNLVCSGPFLPVWSKKGHMVILHADLEPRSQRFVWREKEETMGTRSANLVSCCRLYTT